MRRSVPLCGVVFLVGSIYLLAAEEEKGQPARSPKEELSTFRLAKGFRAELVASEPDVVDPVAMAFDEDGRLYVAEMRGYPNGGVGKGDIASGKIKRLEDRDGDGVFEKVSTFAEGLRLPMSVMPWKGGLLVGVAPDLIYLEDTDNDGKADKRRTLYTGFDLENIQQMLNGLQWGLDNWVYGCAGLRGGTIHSAEKPDAPPVTLRGRGIRFHPEQPATLEPTSGGGQYGISADEGQHWFTNTNSQHLRHIILPDHYLRRNPYLTIGAVTLDIPDHGASCKVHRLSAFEAWRVERTRRRSEGKDAKRFATTELVPGGFSTSTCSPVVYTADAFPAAYRGNVFLCDPANNLVHRDILEEKGATFVARRGDVDCEFLASTDNWFRPVFLTIGPDGALYLADFYREVIETPLSLPDDIKAKLNLESRGRGRIWRIRAEDAKPGRKPDLSNAAPGVLVNHLADGNSWWRFTAQRLLMERQDRAAVEPLKKLARDAASPVGRVHALWTLHGFKALNDIMVADALKDPSALVREQALRLAEGRLADVPALRELAIALATDSAPKVRFQLALSLGESSDPKAIQALARVARRDVVDPWTQLAVLSSAGRSAPTLLIALARDKESLAAGPAALQFLTRLAAVVGAQPDDAALARAFELLGEEGEQAAKLAILEGLGQGFQSSQRSLRHVWEQPPASLKDSIDRARPFFDRAAVAVRDEKQPDKDRLAAVRLLGFGPFQSGVASLKGLLTPQTPAELQLAAVRALSAHDDPAVADALLEPWAGYSPNVRREALEALFARSARLERLLDHVRDKKVQPVQLDPARIDMLRKHPTASIRDRAKTLFAGQVAPDRLKIIDAYKPVLDLKGNAGHGKEVFKKTCSVCHRLEDVGVEVGPNLLAVLPNKTPEHLLVDVLDPSREVDPRYINYVLSTKAGRVFTGLIAVETPSSVTLRRAENAQDTILRTQIDEIQATAKSVMPEEMEKQLSHQDLADVIAYLLAVVRK